MTGLTTFKLQRSGIKINLPDLIIPHPRMKERSFVILPLLEIEQNLRLPCGTPISELALLLSSHFEIIG